MSLRRRLFNVARTEATYAATRLRAAAGGLFELRRPPPAETSVNEEFARIRAEVEAELAEGAAWGRTATARGFGMEPPEVRRFYANLELPLGAPATEVKAAYRRLMRRYHPDKHSKDPERARAAHQLAHELRQAYEGLLRYLEAG